MRALLLAAGLWAGAALAQEALPDAARLFATTLTDVDGKPAAMEAFRGKPLVVNFWARWCGPCREEIPELAQRAAGGREATVLGIALDDNAEAVRDFARAYGIPYAVLLLRQEDMPLLKALGNARAGLPFTLALDRRGRVAFSKLGRLSAADLDAAFAAAARTQ